MKKSCVQQMTKQRITNRADIKAGLSSSTVNGRTGSVSTGYVKKKSQSAALRHCSTALRQHVHWPKWITRKIIRRGRRIQFICLVSQCQTSGWFLQQRTWREKHVVYNFAKAQHKREGLQLHSYVHHISPMPKHHAERQHGERVRQERNRDDRSHRQQTAVERAQKVNYTLDFG